MNETYHEAYIVPNHTGPTEAIAIDPTLCIACNACAAICRIQTILPNPEKGKPPVVAYPDECWYCGVCMEACPTGALEMRLPINQRVFFKDKETGEVFRIGGSEAPPKSFFRPPYGWLSGNEYNGLFRELERKERPVQAYIDPAVCRELGRYFGEKEQVDRGEKISAMLHAIGFDKVYLSDRVPEDGEAVTLFAGKVPQPADYTMDVRSLSAFLHRGCTTNFTAVKTWREIPDRPFDRAVSHD